MLQVDVREQFIFHIESTRHGVTYSTPRYVERSWGLSNGLLGWRFLSHHGCTWGSSHESCYVAFLKAKSDNDYGDAAADKDDADDDDADDNYGGGNGGGSGGDDDESNGEGGAVDDQDNVDDWEFGDESDGCYDRHADYDDGDDDAVTMTIVIMLMLMKD